jgi:pimeloyl-ACP methyl ester carboxylesterase
MGNSAGARVALAAAEMSPEKSIERVIVIAPAVSCGYDLKGVLKASKCGVDNFYSCDDNVLEAAVYYATLADGTRTAAAGQVGFQAPGDPRAAALYCNVRNYPWNDSFVGGGGHFAWTRPHNMKKVLPPLLTPCMCVVSFEPAPPGVRKMPAAK